MGILHAIEGNQHVHQVEGTLIRVVPNGLASGGDGLCGITAHHVRPRQNEQRRGILRVVLERLLGVTLGALRIVRTQCQLTQQRRRLG